MAPELETPEPETIAPDLGNVSLSDYRKVREGDTKLEEAKVDTAAIERNQVEGPEPSTSDGSEASEAGRIMAARKGTLAGRKASIQKDIDTLIKTKGATKAELDALTAQKVKLQKDIDDLGKRTAPAAVVAEPEKKIPAPAAAAAPVKVEPKADDTTDPEPNVDDYTGENGKTYEKWVIDHTRWTVRDERRDLDAKAAAKTAEANAKSEAEASERAIAEVVAHHQTRTDAFKQEHADYDTVIANPDTVATPDMYRFIVESDLGPALAYALGQDPDESKRIAALPTIPARFKAMSKLEAKLETPASAALSGPDDAAPVTDAPDPIKPVGSGPTASKVPLGKTSHAEYKRRRMKGEV